MSELDPIDPSRALKLFLADRKGNQSAATIQSDRSRLSFFIEWLEDQGVDNLNDLTGRMVKEYQLDRREKTNWKPVTEKTQMDTVRVFVRWAEGIEAVEANLSDRVQSPDLDAGDNISNQELNSSKATQMLRYLEKYHYCTIHHVTLAVMWHTMCRRGAIRSLDVDDYDPREEHLHFVHRPETGTPLKNKDKSERYVAVSESIAELLNDWIANKRPDVTDEYGREPLLATKQGRIHPSTVMGYAYKYTQPCRPTGECPLGRDPETCESTHHDEVSTCPESVSSHPIRRGSITHWLRSDVPPRIISDRADVSERVIDMHYDERTALEQMEQRRRFLGNI